MTAGATSPAMPAVGSPAPDFTLPSTAGTDVTLSSLRGKNVLIAFFPLAFTSTCTTELLCFTEDFGAFQVADTVVLFRFFEAAGAVKQAISVVKKRTGRHERTIRELELGAAGVRIGEPIAGFQGVLTGTPELARGGLPRGEREPPG